MPSIYWVVQSVLSFGAALPRIAAGSTSTDPGVPGANGAPRLDVATELESAHTDIAIRPPLPSWVSSRDGHQRPAGLGCLNASTWSARGQSRSSEPRSRRRLLLQHLRCPSDAVERRIVWFAVPDSTCCIELREALTPTPTRLRLCTEPHRVHRVAAELSRSGVTVAQAGLTRDGSPRAISFRDPGRNYWELYTSIIAVSPPPDLHRSIARSWRSLTRRVRA
jgi:hypothetical protein